MSRDPRHGIGRRQFLKGLGGFTLSIPMLPSLLTSRQAFAQATGQPPIKMIAIMSVNGQYERSYWPSIVPSQELQSGVFGMRLSDLEGSMSPVLDSFFNPYREKMNVVRGLDHVGWGDHNDGVFLTASSGIGGGNNAPLYGVSIDSIMEESKSFYPTEPDIRAIRVTHDYYFRNPSFTRVNGKATHLPVLRSDAALFSYIFDKFGLPKATIERNRAQKLTAIDRVFPQYQALLADRRISTEDKNRLRQHFDTLSQTQSKIRTAAIKSCAKPAFSAWKKPLNQKQRYLNINDIVVSSFACDLTRIAVITIPDFNDNYSLSHSDYHGNSHNLETNLAAAAKSAEYNRWVASIVADLIGKLDATKEADGSSMLDNCLLFWGNEISFGNDHRPECLPLITAGGAGGKIKTGYYLDYRRRPFLHVRNGFPAVGQPYSQFLAGVMNTMGVPTAEYRQKWGASDGLFGQFSPPEIIKSHYEPYRTRRDQSLPFLFGS